MNGLLDILTHTPVWVWLLLAYLLYVGFKATRTHVLSLSKLFIMPVIFMGLKYTVVMSNSFFVYIVYLLIGVGIGWMVAKKTPIQILKDLKSIQLPGNYSTLSILILFFIVEYIFGYLEASQPVIAAQYAIIEISLSALFSGFMLGKAFCYSYRFYHNENKAA